MVWKHNLYNFNPFKITKTFLGGLMGIWSYWMFFMTWNMYCAVVERKGCYINLVTSNWIIELMYSISLLNFHPLVLLVIEISWYCKCVFIISFSLISFRFMYFKTLLLCGHAFRPSMSSWWINPFIKFLVVFFILKYSFSDINRGIPILRLVCESIPFSFS